MALSGVLTVNFDVKSPADKFFKAFVEKTSVPAKYVGELEIEAVDWVKRIGTVKMKGNRISKRYKTLKGTITVTPKENGGGSNVGWTVEYEKVSAATETGVPHLFIDHATKYSTKIDDDLLE